MLPVLAANAQPLPLSVGNEHGQVFDPDKRDLNDDVETPRPQLSLPQEEEECVDDNDSPQAPPQLSSVLDDDSKLSVEKSRRAVTNQRLARISRSSFRLSDHFENGDDSEAHILPDAPLTEDMVISQSRGQHDDDDTLENGIDIQELVIELREYSAYTDR